MPPASLPPGDALAMLVRVGRERRLRPGSREPRAREAKANSAALAYLRTTAV